MGNKKLNIRTMLSPQGALCGAGYRFYYHSSSLKLKGEHFKPEVYRITFKLHSRWGFLNTQWSLVGSAGTSNVSAAALSFPRWETGPRWGCGRLPRRWRRPPRWFWTVCWGSATCGTRTSCSGRWWKRWTNRRKSISTCWTAWRPTPPGTSWFSGEPDPLLQ